MVSNLSSKLIPFVVRMVFRNVYYSILAIAISISFWVVFSIFDQLLFLSPILYFYLPEDAIPKFVVSTIISLLLGIVISMNIFTVKFLKVRFSKSLFSAGGLGILSSSCASCSSFGFAMISSLGGIGITFSSFISNYEVYLQFVSIGALLYALFSIKSKLTNNCSLKNFV